MTGQPAAGGGRWIDVPAERIDRWLRGFDGRHGVVATRLAPEIVAYRADDGAVAECHVPFPPLATPQEQRPGLATEPLVSHVMRDRMVGVLLVRLGGYAAGVFQGNDLVASKVGSRLVHGRHSAGGQSQRRFQRRRDKQAREAFQEAADVAARVLLPYAGQLEAVVCGGDRHAVDAVADDPRLRPLFALAVERFLAVPDPKLAVLRATPEQFRRVRIRLTEPG
ncbi:MAG: hypothetical protein GEV03_11235 [Streptosporangiales bacterium]|nr:hypothetical protein [Streptosporangiales bacterium]